MYVDETVIIVHHKNLDNSIIDLQISLYLILDWITK
jgi:hypothetical protein